MPNARIKSTAGEIDLYYEETGRARFNKHVAEFLWGVETGRWGTWTGGR